MIRTFKTVAKRKASILVPICMYLCRIFQILWKSRCNIFDSFPSHLKKLHSILRFWLEKLICGFFPLVSLEKKENFSSQNFSAENNYCWCKLRLYWSYLSIALFLISIMSINLFFLKYFFTFLAHYIRIYWRIV